jgi:hypothetical protein
MPKLSPEGVQESVTLVYATDEPLRLPGGVGKTPLAALVVKLHVLLFPETLPEASRALTMKLYAVLGSNPFNVTVCVLDVVAGLDKIQTPFWNMSYATTPLPESVELFQFRTTEV